jgi:Protein of unknown function (DUF1573)
MNGYQIRLSMKPTTLGLALGMFITGTGIATLQAQNPPAPGVASNSAALSPKIHFSSTIYDFGRSRVGVPVKHDFIFTNTGQAVLEVKNVRPGCGCTTAGSWTRQVEPGKTGIIPIQYNAAGVPGPIIKSVTVTCNDPGQSTVILEIKGVLWKPVEVSPAYAIFNVTSETVSNITSSVRIINNEETPLTVSKPESNNRFFTAELKTNKPGREFEVVIRPVPPLQSSNTGGLITLKSSSTNEPIIRINTAAILQPTLAVNPPTIILPPPTNMNNIKPVVYVRNNDSSPFKLSDPEVNVKGVGVQVREVQPGRYATLTLTFPQGFTITPDEKVRLLVKTGLARMPTFEVPVVQRPH